MSMKMMNAAYLVDNVALLSLQEKQEGVEFHCFDMDSKVQIAEGHIGWDVLDKQPFSTLEESARVAALKEIPQLDGLTVAPVAPEMLEQALMAPRLSTEVTVDQRNIMSIAVPVFHRAEQEAQPDLACYGFAQTSGELDDALQALNRVYSDLLELAQAEKTVQLLAQDIERTRRRVNALEYVVIPENQRNIRYITMKLEENERGNTTRLMKVKDMVLQDAHHYKS